MTKRNIIYGAICALIGVILTLAIGVLTYHPTTVRETEKTVIKTDTITKFITMRDTITRERLKPVYAEVVRYDTIKADTILQVERKTYDTVVRDDSLFLSVRTVISGIDPSLDSLSYSLNVPMRTITQTIETECIVKQKAHLNYGVGVMAGYSIFAKQPDIMAGVYIGYSF